MRDTSTSSDPNIICILLYVSILLIFYLITTAKFSTFFLLEDYVCIIIIIYDLQKVSLYSKTELFSHYSKTELLLLLIIIK